MSKLFMYAMVGFFLASPAFAAQGQTKQGSNNDIYVLNSQEMKSPGKVRDAVISVVCVAGYKFVILQGIDARQPKVMQQILKPGTTPQPIRCDE